MNQKTEEIKEILQNQTGDVGEKELLTRLVAIGERQLFHEKVRTAAAVVTVLAVMVSLLMLVPQALKTVSRANTLMDQVSDTVVLAEEAIESVTAMSGTITDMGENMDAFISENSESVAEIMEKIEAVDFEGLNSAIKDLSDVVAPLAKFFNRF